MLTYDEVLEHLAEQRLVVASDVYASALNRIVWVSGNGSPGCLYDNGPNYSRTKKDAIDSLAFIFDHERGCITELRRYHSWTAESGERCEISRHTLREIL
jgi:hypothetical protein